MTNRADPTHVFLVDDDSGPGKPYSETNPFPIRDHPRDSDGSNYLSSYVTNEGSEDMSIDGSVTAVEFFYEVPTGKKLYLRRCFLTIEDGAIAFEPNNFGDIAGGLTNGLEISITPNGESKQILENWQTNRQTRDTMFDFDQEFKTDGAYIGRWTFVKDINENSFVLSAGDKFSVLVRDNLSSLDFLSLKMKGRIIDV